jgi:hypothetical protein
MIRIRIWMLLAVVAIVGIGLGIETLMRRASGFQSLARHYAGKEDQCTMMMSWVQGPSLESKGLQTKYRVLRERYSTLRAKYEYASSHPWVGLRMETPPADEPP